MKPTASTFSNDDHDFLANLEGTFVGEVTFQDPALSSYNKKDLNGSKMQNHFIYEDHFLKQEFEGHHQGEATLSGTGFIGYNQQSSQFEGFWLDNQINRMNYDTGVKSGNCLTMHWNAAADGQAQKKRKSTTTVLSKNEYQLDFYQESESGEEQKTLSMRFKRQ